MIIKRTDNGNADFKLLVSELDKELWSVFGNSMEYFQPLNAIDHNETAVVVYDGNKGIGCGCLRRYDRDTVEIKRMFVLPAYRRGGAASLILAELEAWAAELNYGNVILETGKKLAAAVNLYKKHHFRITENWGPYIGVEGSVCMSKSLLKNSI